MRFFVLIGFLFLLFSSCKKDPGERRFERNTRLICREKWIINSVHDTSLQNSLNFYPLEFDFKTNNELIVTEPGLVVNGSYSFIRSTNNRLSIQARTYNAISFPITYFNRTWHILSLDRKKMLWRDENAPQIEVVFVVLKD